MSDVEQLPEGLQERLARLQQLQSIVQSLSLQRQRIEFELNEAEQALKTLEGLSSDTKVYKSVGAILVEKPRDEVIKGLKESKELLELRSKALEKQENKARERLNNLQQAIQRELSQMQAPGY
ncbi:MAG: prefoldin subunit beta [Candidatus Bathyarchaeia archaeon]